MSLQQRGLCRVLAALCFVVCEISSLAQAVPAQHQHSNAPNASVIDGSANPDLIPDSMAYRLYLLTVSTPANPTIEDIKRQTAYLAKIGMQDNDRLQMIAILAGFKSQYSALVDRFNQQAMAAQAQGQPVDQTLFVTQRDDLVEAAHSALKRVLSAEGLGRLEAHIRSEKKNMKVITKEGQ